MSVKQILRTKGSDIFTMAPTATVAEISAELTARRIGAVVILEGERLAGIVSERDVVRALAKDGAAALGRTAGEIMTRAVETCGPEDGIADVMQRMTAGRFRHFPVMVSDRMVGLISIGDVVKFRIAEAEHEAATMRDYITAG